MTMEESAREAIDEGKRILASVVAQLREAWRPAKPKGPPEMDAEGWRKKYEAAANEASSLRCEVASLKGKNAELSETVNPKNAQADEVSMEPKRRTRKPRR